MVTKVIKAKKIWKATGNLHVTSPVNVATDPKSTRDESPSNELTRALCRSLNDGANDHSARSDENASTASEMVTPECRDSTANEKSDFVEGNNGAEIAREWVTDSCQEDGWAGNGYTEFHLPGRSRTAENNFQ
ncbi:hypothetical protein B7463_g874, partial [Scytalidium lignicola]